MCILKHAYAYSSLHVRAYRLKELGYFMHSYFICSCILSLPLINDNFYLKGHKKKLYIMQLIVYYSIYRR